MNLYVRYIIFALGFTSAVQSKSDFENIQKLILQTINEIAPDFEPCNANLLQKAVFGDMIEIKRQGYFHWCVFVQDETVIQLHNPEFDNLNEKNVFDNFTGVVQVRNLIDLANKDFCRINNKITESKQKGLRSLSNNEILTKMEYEYEQNVTFYNIVNYNCEHFATKLKFGVPFSSQIEAVKEIVQKNKFKETVAKMFEVAANASPTKYQNESITDLFTLNI